MREDSISQYIHFVVRTIQRLIILREWSQLTPQQKGEYVLKLFEQEMKQRIMEIRNDHPKQATGEKRINKLLETFRNNHTKLMVSRGHVMRLFEEVYSFLEFDDVCLFVIFKVRSDCIP